MRDRTSVKTEVHLVKFRDGAYGVRRTHTEGENCVIDFIDFLTYEWREAPEVETRTSDLNLAKAQYYLCTNDYTYPVELSDMGEIIEDTGLVLDLATNPCD